MAGRENITSIVALLLIAISVLFSAAMWKRNRMPRRKYLLLVFGFVWLLSSWISLTVVSRLPVPTEQVRVTALREKNNQAIQDNIYLVGVFCDGKEVRLETETDDKWFWKNDSGWYVWLNETYPERPADINDSFVLSLPAGKNRSIDFFTNRYKGLVQLEYQGTTQTVDCYSEEDGRISAHIADTEDSVLFGQTLKIFAIYSIIYISVSFVLLFLIFLGFTAMKKKRNRNYGRKKTAEPEKMMLLILSIISIAVGVSLFAAASVPAFTEDIHITALKMRNGESDNDEIFLTDIYANGKKLALEKDQDELHGAEVDWFSWKDDNDPLRNGDMAESTTIVIPEGKGRNLVFYRGPGQGFVRIDWSSEIWIVDCYSPEAGTIRVDINDTNDTILTRHQMKRTAVAIFAFFFTCALCIGACLAFLSLSNCFAPTVEAYLGLWEKLKGGKLLAFYFLHYSILFSVMCTVVFYPFLQKGITFIWETDGIPHYLPDLIFVAKSLKNNVISLLSGNGWAYPLFDFAQPGRKLSSQFDILAMLSVFWKEEKQEAFYNFLILLRLYLSGISFSLLGLKLRRSPSMVLIGAESYVFCDYALYSGIRHIQFISPMIQLPLLILGVEKILRKESPWFFVLCVCSALLFSVYYGGMLAVIVIVYAFCRFFCMYRGRIRQELPRFLRSFLLAGFIGCLLGGIAWVPSLMNAMESGRIAQEGSVSLSSGWIIFFGNFYKRFFSSYLITPGQTYYSLCLGFTVLTLPSIIVMFISRSEKYLSLKILFVLSTLLLWSPAASYVLSGFSTYSERWCFAYALCNSVLLMTILPKMSEMPKKETVIIIIVCLLLPRLCYFVFKDSWNEEGSYGAWLLLSGTLVFFCASKYGKKYAVAAALIITCISSWYTSYLLFDANFGDYTKEFASVGEAYQRYSDSAYGVFAASDASEDSDFYRVSGNSVTWDSLGAAPLYDLRGLSYQTSYYYPAYKTWNDELESSSLGENHHHYGPADRLGLLSLANVKYYVWNEYESGVKPFGFRNAETMAKADGQADTILENQYWLPIGYTYTRYISQAEYERLSAIEKQEIQLQAVAVDTVRDVREMEHLDFSTDVRALHYRIDACDAVTWDPESGTLSVLRNHATMQIRFWVQKESEVYLRTEDLNLQANNSLEWFLSARSENGKAMARYFSDSFLYSNKKNSQILNLGHFEKGVHSCILTFPEKGDYMLRDLELLVMPVDEYAERIEALREESLENITTDWRSIRGTISVSENKLLCLAIPYDRGWTAFVNGEQAPIMQANSAWMAVKLSPGNYNIEFRYWPRGLTGGMILSAVGAAGLICWKISDVWSDRLKKKENRKKKQAEVM